MAGALTGFQNRCDAVEERELSEVGNDKPVSSQEEDLGPDQIVVLGEEDLEDDDVNQSKLTKKE